ncbi:MAG TPA: hypothetical protein VJ440_08035 [Candidatus Brocadiaceae bacterium]|nr:hypothetical protein [Candidatus Brocadiaceae bacterium]
MELKLREREKEIAREKETIDGQVAGKLRLERGEQIGRVMQSTVGMYGVSSPYNRPEGLIAYSQG